MGQYQRILLIDDSEDDALLMQRRFSSVGFDDPLFHIADPEQAIAYLHGEDGYADRSRFPIPEVIFLDLKMPRVDGFQVLKWIKAQPHLLRAIVVVLTGVSDLKTIQQAYNLGAHSFLSKDANEAELRNVATFLKDYARVSSVLPEPPKSDGGHKAA